MPYTKPTHRLGVHLILSRGGKILLIRRANTGWNDGKYAFPAGHVENGERLKAAMVREAMEEVGIRIKDGDLTMVHELHAFNGYASGFVFMKCSKWTGTPRNMEPDKCVDVAWFDTKKLPKNTAPYVKLAMRNINLKLPISEYRHARL